MKKFKYSLQNILNVKYRLEEQAKGEFSIAQAKLNEEIAKLENIYKQMNNYEAELKKLVSGRLDFQEILFTENAIEAKKNEAKEQKKRVIAANRALEQARAKLNEVMVERKTHEKLRDKAFEEYMDEFNKEEARETDELVSYRYNARES